MTKSPTGRGKGRGGPTMVGGQAALLSTELRVVSDDQLQDLHWASLEVLERTGVYIQHEEARELLRGAGARVAGDRTHIPSFLVENALRTAPRHVTIYRRTGEPLAFLGGRRVYFASMNDGLWMLDPYTGARRPFTSDDYRLTVRPVEASPYVVGMSGGGHASDFPAPNRILVNFKRSTTHTTKAQLISASEAWTLREIIDMASAIAGGAEALRARPFLIPKAEPTAPLCHVYEATEMLLIAARARLPVVYYSMTAAGSTAPCSDAGAVVVANADVLAGLVMHQLAAPGAPFIHGLMPGVMDMASTIWAYGSPDFFLLAAVAAKLGQYYGLPTYGTGGCSDAKEVDLQLATELSLGSLLAAQSGANLVHNVGLMDSGLLVSPAQIVLTDEALGMVEHMVRGIDTGPSGLQLDLIDQVGPRGQYLTSEHTLHNFRHFWYPRLFERRRHDLWRQAGATGMLEKLNQLTCRIIETTEVEPLPEEVARELDARERTWR